MIDVSTVDWDFLTRLASHITLASSGHATVVSAFAPDVNLWGAAGTRTDGMFEVKLSPNQPPHEFCFTYFHEVGHVALKNVHRPIGTGIGLDTVHRMQDPERRESMRTYLVKMETETDEWARQAARAFESAAGMPLEQYLFGG